MGCQAARLRSCGGLEEAGSGGLQWNDMNQGRADGVNTGSSITSGGDDNHCRQEPRIRFCTRLPQRGCTIPPPTSFNATPQCPSSLSLQRLCLFVTRINVPFHPCEVAAMPSLVHPHAIICVSSAPFAGHETKKWSLVTVASRFFYCFPCITLMRCPITSFSPKSINWKLANLLMECVEMKLLSWKGKCFIPVLPNNYLISIHTLGTRVIRKVHENWSS